jgi:hypothetical protein
MIGILVAIVNPLMLFLSNANIKRSQEKHAEETKTAVDAIHQQINSRMSELLEVTKSDAKQEGATEERNKEKPNT